MPRAAMLVAAVALLAVGFSRHVLATDVVEVSSATACSVLKKRMARHDGVPANLVDKTWFCDITNSDIRGWWVIGLRSSRTCEGICSNLRGWFAVSRTTAEVREFEMGEYAVGKPIPNP